MLERLGKCPGQVVGEKGRLDLDGLEHLLRLAQHEEVVDCRSTPDGHLEELSTFELNGLDGVIGAVDCSDRVLDILDCKVGAIQPLHSGT